MTWCRWSSCWRAWSIRAPKRHWPTQFAYTKIKISYKCRKKLPCCPCKTFFSLSICFRFNLESWSIFRLRAAFGSFKKLFSSRRTSSRFDASAILFLLSVNSIFRRSISLRKKLIFSYYVMVFRYYVMILLPLEQFWAVSLYLCILGNLNPISRQGGATIALRSFSRNEIFHQILSFSRFNNREEEVLRWLQNLNIKSIHVCMSAVYPLRNDHYVILSRAIKYFSLFEILSGCNWIIFCGEVMLHYFVAA